MNKKTKLEQFFILVIMCIGVFGIFALSGCGGGKSCETIKCGSEEYMGGTATGVSIPGCGGCLSSGKGCNSCLWPQSCKISCASWEGDENTNSNEESSKDKASIKGCDTRYYGDGCLGCGQREKTCYSGCINMTSGEDKVNGFFYGGTGREEKIIGCANGCGGCVADGNIGAEILDELEYVEEIR